MNNKLSNRYDRFGYVQRGYDNDLMCEELERSYRDWKMTRDKDLANMVKAEPKQAKQAEPKPDRRILLAM
jgi:hypothetical protein